MLSYSKRAIYLIPPAAKLVWSPVVYDGTNMEDRVYKLFKIAWRHWWTTPYRNREIYLLLFFRDMLDMVAQRLRRFESDNGTKQSFSYDVIHFHNKLFFNPGLFHQEAIL